MKKSILLFCVIAASLPAFAEIKMPAIFGDNMVLQRGKPACIWGKSDAKSKIEVQFGSNKAHAKADKDGNWKLYLKPMKADKNAKQLKVFENGKEEKSFNNVLVGEVWVLSGQSNMEYPVSGWNPKNPDAENVKKRANYPLMRSIKLVGCSARGPQSDVISTSKGWRVTTPECVLSYSAVGFNFAEIIMKDIDVPVAIIDTSLGGSKMCAWIPSEYMNKDEYLAPQYKNFLKALEAYDYKKALETYNADMKKYTENVKAGKKLRRPRQPLPDSPYSQQATFSGLYNARISPIGGYTARGVLWYQGESDSNIKAEQFASQFEKIVDSWRALWKDKSLWFLQVQLTSFETSANWPEARKGQFDAAKSIKNCGIVNIIDLGDKKDIHPLNKKDVGKRLANLALRKVYKKKAPNFNTSYASCKFDGSKATLKLDRECSNEKVSLEGEMRGIEVKVDGKWVAPKSAKLQGNKLVVSADSKIEGVRYLWKNWANDDVCLFNSSKVPVFPFIFETK